ncbi:hypothetical protein, partial [Mycobacterium avium]|uniref:hypothetical protein n=1 Tax=Mycobacterium avium TaxID=1764 RepID=UPI001F4280A2
RRDRVTSLYVVVLIWVSCDPFFGFASLSNIVALPVVSCQLAAAPLTPLYPNAFRTITPFRLWRKVFPPFRRGSTGQLTLPLILSTLAFTTPPPN